MSRRLICVERSKTNASLLVKVYRNSDWDEYTCEVPGNPDATYYTNDKRDAEGTAKKMLENLELEAAVHDLVTIPGELI